jgi:hypothetical protein
MNRFKDAFTYAALVFVSAVLTNLFVFIGAPFLRLLREAYGSAGYLLGGAVISAVLLAAGLYPMAGLTLVMWLAVFLQREVSVRWRLGLLTQVSLISIFLGTLSFAGLFFGARASGSTIQKLVEELAKGILPMSTATKTESLSTLVTAVSTQMWSILVILIGVSLVLSDLLAPKLCKLMRVFYPQIQSKDQLLGFKVPDFFIFIVLLTFFLSFFKGVPSNAANFSVNIFNILAVIYFFQGLAVSECFMIWFRMGYFFRVVFYIFIVGNFFPLLTLVGVLDYWIDFRKRWGVLGAPHSESKR